MPQRMNSIYLFIVYSNELFPFLKQLQADAEL